MEEKYLLYIDDDLDDQELLKAVMNTKTHSIEIVQAHNGVEGLAVLNELVLNGHPPYLVVVDMNMPVLNGIDTIKQIRAEQSFRHVPLVVFSTSIIHDAFLEEQAIPVVEKPADVHQFNRVIEMFINYGNSG